MSLYENVCSWKFLSTKKLLYTVFNTHITADSTVRHSATKMGDTKQNGDNIPQKKRPGNVDDIDKKRGKCSKKKVFFERGFEVELLHVCWGLTAVIIC